MSVLKIDDFPVFVKIKTSDAKTILGHLDFINKGDAHYYIFRNGIQRSFCLAEPVDEIEFENVQWELW